MKLETDNKDLTLIKYGNIGIITILKDNEPWFVAKEVAEVLGYQDPNDAIKKHCKHMILFSSGDLPGLEVNPKGMTLIPERDIYRLVMRSKLPSAEKFEEWVVSDAPTI